MIFATTTGEGVDVDTARHQLTVDLTEHETEVLRGRTCRLFVSLGLSHETVARIFRTSPRTVARTLDYLDAAEATSNTELPFDPVRDEAGLD
jgi:hypothetical protein